MCVSEGGRFIADDGGVSFVRNSAEGSSPRGGALAIQNARELRLRGVTFESNVVRVLSAQGYGGAIHIDSGTLELQDCSLHGNTVQLASNVAEDASGGGIFVSLQASALLVRVRMHSQQAGGVGLYKSRGDQAEVAQRHRAERAEHLLVWAVARLERCSVLSTPGSSTIANAASAQVVVANGGRVALLNSLLSSSEPGRVALQLIGNTAQGIIRGCSGLNVTVGSSDGRTQLATQLGIVGAAFEPPIAPSVQTVQPPNRGVQLAEQQFCDELAICKQVWSGGVSCSCGGVGLRYKPGYPTDGQHCEQDPTLKASVQAAMVSITVPKPGRSIPLQLIAAATGEMPFSIV
jgi:hypothetical protein